MRLIQRLPDEAEIKEKYPISDTEEKRRAELLLSARKILGAEDGRKLLLIGPCSADREDAVLEYADRLSKISERIGDRFLVIMRVYTGKPRTDSRGYKGLLHRPKADNKEDDLIRGIEAMRQIHQKVVRETGMFTADELLYPDTFHYMSDLLVYMAIGARSVEDQQHRMIASGVDVPVRMKNPTSGNYDVLLNAIVAAQSPQRMLYSGYEAETEGNPYAHAVLRGFVNEAGRNVPNYHYEDLCLLHDRYTKLNLLHPGVIVDCNHSNSNKRYEEQGRIAEDVLMSCRRNPTIDKFVRGIMIESYLEDGNQMIGGGIYGKSITDPCLGWRNTEELLLKLSEL